MDLVRDLLAICDRTFADKLRRNANIPGHSSFRCVPSSISEAGYQVQGGASRSVLSMSKLFSMLDYSADGRTGPPAVSDLVYIAPSGASFCVLVSAFQVTHPFPLPIGVLKERIKPEDIFILRLSDRQPISRPLDPSLKISACTPLFYAAYKIRSAGTCIHGHSQASVLVSLLWEGETFEIANQEQIKGVRRGGMGKAWDNTDTLVVPIIDNKPYEDDLEGDMEEARSF
jgi:hypothetical protein